jgi:hypothetical protein
VSAEHGNASLPRAVVLQKEDSNRQTLGFPPCSLAEPKRVNFFTPLYAKCMSVDGLWTTNCWALSVWDTGAQLEVVLPGDLSEFYLLFTSPPRPVSRMCRRVSTRGNIVEVAYLRKQPAFLQNAGMDL